MFETIKSVSLIQDNVPLTFLQSDVIRDNNNDNNYNEDKPTEGSIQMKNIYFSYRSKPLVMVCDDFNLSISSGESVALVGVSGCGKVFCNILLSNVLIVTLSLF